MVSIYTGSADDESAGVQHSSTAAKGILYIPSSSPFVFAFQEQLNNVKILLQTSKHSFNYTLYVTSIVFACPN